MCIINKRIVPLLLTLALAISAAAALSACGNDKGKGGADSVYKLKFDTPDAIDSITGSFISQWADKIRDESGGRIDITVFPSSQLGAVPDIVTNLKKGISDIAWGSPAMFSGQFPVMEGTNLPMLDIPDSRVGTDLLWNIFENTDLMTEEFSGIHVLMLTNCCGYYFASAPKAKPIMSVDDLKGEKVRVQGTYPSIMMQALGAEPISLHASDIYESMNKNVLDAMLTDITTFKTYKLSEVTSHVVETSVYRFSGFISMNEDSYNELPDDLKAIMDKYSGREESYLFGDAWAEGVDTGIKAYTDAGVTTSVFSDADIIKIKDAAQAASDKWIADMDGKGLDGKNLYDTYVSTLAEINKG
jgi:TRAP-type C4-dicarboxylate transport system substrate-binding protein